MAELLYSSSFLELVQGIARDPRTAHLRFRLGWTEKFLQATRIDVPLFDIMAQIARWMVRRFLGSGDEDTILLARFLFATGITWTNFVDTILNSTAGIDGSVRLGSAVNEWARGKVWMVDHTAVMPPTGGNTTARLYEDVVNMESASYQVSGFTLGPSVQYQPARFSIVLGEGVNSGAPLPYMPPRALPLRTRLIYKARTTDSGLLPTTVSSGPLGGSDLAHGTLELQSGLLPVPRVVGASSAFLGNALVMGPIVAEAETLLHAQLTPWISSAAGGRAFEAADDLVASLKGPGATTKEKLQGVADSAVRGVIDGGFTDGTGIAQAVAAGADEVVVVLNSNATNNPYYVQNLFENGPKPVIPGKPAALFPVFESPNSTQVSDAFEAFHRLRISKNARFLRSFAAGTIKAVTAGNRFWGIERGREVTLHIVNIGSELRIGLLQDFNDYNVLVQEVATTLTDKSNALFVDRVLLPHFLGQGSAAARPRETSLVV